MGGRTRRDGRCLVLARSGRGDRRRAGAAAAGAGAGDAASGARSGRARPGRHPAGQHALREACGRADRGAAGRPRAADAGNPDRAVRSQGADRRRQARHLLEPGAGAGRARGGAAAALARRRAAGRAGDAAARLGAACRGRAAGGPARDPAPVPARRPGLAAVPRRARPGRDPRRRHGSRQDGPDPGAHPDREGGRPARRRRRWSSARPASSPTGATRPSASRPDCAC